MLARISILHYKTFKNASNCRFEAIFGLGRKPKRDFKFTYQVKKKLSGRVGRLKFLRAAIDHGFHSE
jgi:hypothetical protein